MELTKEEIILIHQFLLAPRFQNLAEAQTILPIAVKLQEQLNKWTEEDKKKEEIKVTPMVEKSKKTV